jgi:uncharacterized protein YlbG (UPF0298 family)
MEAHSLEISLNTLNNQSIKSQAFISTIRNNHDDNLVSEILSDERRERFINYISCLGLAEDKNLVVLSSLHHYFYDEEEMKNVSTIVALKELNLVRNLKKFLHSVYNNLPQRSNFVGCFVDNNKGDSYEVIMDSATSASYIENGIVSKWPFLNLLYNLVDLRTHNHLSRRNVHNLLEDYGFRVNDMSEHNGLTFFYSQKCR